MRSIIILLLCVSYGFASDCWPSKWNVEKEQKGVHFPEDIIRDSILSKMHLTDSVCGIGIKKWPYINDTYIVVSEDLDSLYVGIVQVLEESYTLNNRYSKKLSKYGYRFDRFDFAPYRLNKESIAFGLRFYGNGGLAGGGYGCQNLVLFAPIKDSLQVVLSTVMEGSAMIAGEWLEEGIRMHYDETSSAILIIGKPDSTGYNRIIKKMTTNESVSNEGLFPNDTFYWEAEFTGSESQFHDKENEKRDLWQGMYTSKSDMEMSCCCDRLEFEL